MNNAFSKAAVWVIIALVLFTVFRQFETRQSRVGDIPYSQFMKEAENGQVDSVQIDGRAVRVRTRDGRTLSTYVPSTGDIWMVSDLMKYGVQVNAKPEEEQSVLMQIFISWFPMLLLIGVWIFFMRQIYWKRRTASSLPKFVIATSFSSALFETMKSARSLRVIVTTSSATSASSEAS